MMMIVTMTKVMMMTNRPMKKSVEVEAAMTWSPWRQPTALRFPSYCEVLKDKGRLRSVGNLEIET